MTFCVIDGLFIISRIMNKDKRFVVLLHSLFCPLLKFWSTKVLMIYIKFIFWYFIYLMTLFWFLVLDKKAKYFLSLSTCRNFFILISDILLPPLFCFVASSVSISSISLSKHKLAFTTLNLKRNWGNYLWWPKNQLLTIPDMR